MARRVDRSNRPKNQTDALPSAYLAPVTRRCHDAPMSNVRELSPNLLTERNRLLAELRRLADLLEGLEGEHLAEAVVALAAPTEALNRTADLWLKRDR